ncbi:MAG: uroporphyrinogen decarboxylase family protein [Candidatus Aminicenantes bacterium]|nr:uroporphyrinogen decarboxylase family protein [Candidatus Aminicenantes bacterium]
MTGYERIAAAMDGRMPDKIPIMLHNFMMAARERGITMRQFRQSPQLIAESFIRAAEAYDVDGVLVDVDTVTLAGAAGVPIDFPDDEPARCRSGRLDRLDMVEVLEPVDIQSYRGVSIWLEAVRLLRRHFGNDIMVRGNCDQAPFSLAGMMRSPAQWMMDLLEERNGPLIFKLLDVCLDVSQQFIRLMGEAGAHMVSNGDSPAGPDLISPGMYRRFALPSEKALVDAAGRLGLPYVLHICGNTSLILKDMVSTGADGLELDYKTDARLAHDLMKDRCTFFGNLDPVNVLALGNRDLVEKKTRELIEIFSDASRLVLNAGCAIPADTPKENIRAMIQVARNFR